MTATLRAFFEDESAAAAVEYAVLVASWSVVLAAAVKTSGPKLNAVFLTISAQLAPYVAVATAPR